MMQVAAEKDLVSIGCLAAQIQQPVRAIESMAVKLGIVPAMKLNSIPHFDGDQAEAISEAFQQRKELQK
jgi:hypothetical protein